ncbi:MAG: hypothetical protein JSV17_00310 [Candidatus Aminicenantes bacterium]|nr:MAG: hypothetical protein JSV17_00310 [Candidatus Aminicenantes bacterium]
MKNQNSEKAEKDQEKPPIFSSWNWWYVAILLNLAVLILLFYLFTKAFE